MDFKKDFLDFEGKIWLNAASEGPLPKVSIAALEESIVWKAKPYLLDNLKFATIPRSLKESIAKLIHVDSKDVILGNSASYGIHILANGFPWEKDDEIIVMQNDFPTDIVPWLALEKRGVKVIQVKPKGIVLEPEDFLENITEKTRLVCVPHVHTFSGYVLQIDKIAQICRKKNIVCVVNISQSAGSMPVDVSSWNVDAVVCAGYKWLLGPYGTGFLWMTQNLRERLEYNQAYWISVCSDEDLANEDALKLHDVKTSRKFDIFATANFFNFVPFRASIDYLTNLVGLSDVFIYNQELIDIFINHLNRDQFNLISPDKGTRRSSLIFISHKDPNRNKAIFKHLTDSHIHTAFWKGNIRISPHLYNTEEDMLKLCSVLHSQ
jgi:cysteine desulfurase/selenocysteine lyase